MNVRLELPRDRLCAGFFELERAAYGRPSDELARRRKAWLDGRPDAELASYGVPAVLDDDESHRYWSL
jgi:hypothetical protein